MLSPRVYVSTFKKYNNGSLGGSWLDLDDYDTEDEFISAAKKIHSDEESPELFFQDYENIPSACVQETKVEWGYLDFLKNMDWLNDHEAAAAAFISIFGVRSLDEFGNHFYCHADCKERFVVDHIVNNGLLRDIPEEVAMYFDYDSYGRDLFISTFHYVDGFVFTKS